MGGGHCQRGSLFRRCAVRRQVRPADFAKYFHDRAGRKFLNFFLTANAPAPQYALLGPPVAPTPRKAARRPARPSNPAERLWARQILLINMLI
jgi:hypothetical protein